MMWNDQLRTPTSKVGALNNFHPDLNTPRLYTPRSSTVAWSKPLESKVQTPTEVVSLG